jgi:hypothetical protein
VAGGSETAATVKRTIAVRTGDAGKVKKVELWLPGGKSPHPLAWSRQKGEITIASLPGDFSAGVIKLK